MPNNVNIGLSRPGGFGFNNFPEWAARLGDDDGDPRRKAKANGATCESQQRQSQGSRPGLGSGGSMFGRMSSTGLLR